MDHLAAKTMEQISAWIPRWLFLPGLRNKWSYRVEIESLSSENLIAEKARKGSLIDLAIRQDALLSKSALLPKMSAGKTQKAIDLQVRQSMPQHAAGLSWSFVEVGREAGRVRHAISLIKTRQLEDLEKEIWRVGCSPRQIFAVEGRLDFPPFIDNRHITDKPIKRWGYAGLAMLFFGVCVVAYDHQSKRHSLQTELDQLSQEKSALAAELIDLRQETSRASEKSAKISDDLTLLNQERHRLKPLIDLTVALDDQTWVSEFAVAGSQMTLSGFTSSNVTEIMKSIRDASWSENVDLNGSVNFDSYSRKDRFSLNVTLSGAPE